jgi:hypothetical protein
MIYFLKKIYYRHFKSKISRKTYEKFYRENLNFILYIKTLFIIIFIFHFIEKVKN